MKRLELETDLGVIIENARSIRARLKPGVKMLAVVKADAYGHGDTKVAEALDRAGLADEFAVATPFEGARVRTVTQKPITVLGQAQGAEEYEQSAKNALIQCVYSQDGLGQLSLAAQKTGVVGLAALKAETGMNRLGARENEIPELLAAWPKNVKMAGLFTHFCVADTDPEFTLKQKQIFERVCKAVYARGFTPVRHAAASTAMLKSGFEFDMVRAGIALYGTGVNELKDVVVPAQRLISRAARIITLEPGETVGYGRRFTAARQTRVMTVPCGYGDGYPRLLGGRAQLLVDGKRANIIGNVCMDMLMADVTDIESASEESEVVLLGRSGSERITPGELAEKAGTIPYEIMLGFSNRVERSWKY